MENRDPVVKNPMTGKENLKNIFVSPYATLFYRYGSVRFFLTSQIGYPLNLIVYSKTCLKRPLKKYKKLFVFSRPIIA